MDFASKYVFVENEPAAATEQFDEDALEAVTFTSAKPSKSKGAPARTAPAAPAPRSSGPSGFFSSLFGGSRREAAAPGAAAPPPADAMEVDSDSDDDLQAQTNVLAQVSAAQTSARVRQVRKATTNIVSLDLGTLGNDAPIFTGDIIRCSSCTAVMNHLSKVASSNSSNGPSQQWTCEFCATVNPVNIEEEELQMLKTDTVDFLIENPPVQEKGDGSEIVVYCIDISGSMCCTSEAPAGWKLREANRLSELNKQFNDDHSNQRLPSERHNVTYVSRLQCVQAAVDNQLALFEKNFPNRRCVLVTFNNEVTVYDPKTKQAHIIAGDHLSDYEYLSQLKLQLNLEDAPISKTRKDLSDLVNGLEERGATALGPALLVSVGIASAVKGSQVVVCTDGLANVGVGGLEALSAKVKDEAALSKLAKFYTDVSDAAVQSGVMVNVISIKGTHTSLEYLAKICLATRGLNDIVDPLNMQNNFDVLLQNPVVATEVNVTMILHPGLKFHDSDSASMTTQVGNATKESSLTFEFELKSKDIIERLVKEKQDLPFQVQISYTKKATGAKMIRVMSRAQPLTQDRDVAEQNANVQVLGLHSVQESARLAQQGNYTKARMRQMAYQKLGAATMSKKAVSVEEKKSYAAWRDQAAKLDEAIVTQKRKESSRGARYHSAEEDLSDSEHNDDADDMETDALTSVPVVASRKKAMKSAASAERSSGRMRSRAEDADGDATSNVLYQAANAWTSAFK